MHWFGHCVYKIKHWMTTSKNTKFTEEPDVNKYLYFRVNNSSNVSVYDVCDVTVEGVNNCSQRGRGPGQGGSCHKRH